MPICFKKMAPSPHNSSQLSTYTDKVDISGPFSATRPGPTCVRVQGLGFGVQGVRCRDWCSGFGVQGAGFRVQGSGFGVWSSGFGVWGPGFRIQGLGCRVCRHLGFVVHGSLNSRLESNKEEEKVQGSGIRA